MKTFLTSALATAALLVALPSHALTVTSASYTGAGYLPVMVESTNAPMFGPESVNAGALKINNSFVAYCIDLTQRLTNLPAEYTASSIGARQGDLEKAVQWMVSNGTFVPGDAATSALNQAIIWEIVYEDTGTYAFDTGDFTLSGVGAFDFSVLANVVPTAEITVWDNDTRQGFVTAVPEPSTYALMALGLAATGFMARRRRPD